MFTDGFEKTAKWQDAFKKALPKIAPKIEVNPEVRRLGEVGGYSKLGPAPKVGKSGNPLTAKYMEEVYGIKNYKE